MAYRLHLYKFYNPRDLFCLYNSINLRHDVDITLLSIRTIINGDQSHYCVTCLPSSWSIYYRYVRTSQSPQSRQGDIFRVSSSHLIGQWWNSCVEWKQPYLSRDSDWLKMLMTWSLTGQIQSTNSVDLTRNNGHWKMILGLEMKELGP